MIKQTLTYTGFDDKQHTGDFYFHLSTSELMDLEVEQEGGMANFLEKVVKSGDAQEIMKQFKRFIALSYGERQDDGSFEKDPQSTEKFMRSPAFDALFMSVLTDPDAASTFINGIIPKDLANKLSSVSIEPNTQKQPQDMTREELLKAWQERDQNMKKPSQETQPL